MVGKRPSAPSDAASEMEELPPKRTMRTHEENQERAYIAASRRADRDIEARMTSALRASECHRKRTGRGLKITREAVLGDEQYESDDDETARRSRVPGVPAATSSGLPSAYVANTAAHHAEIDREFAKHFPHVQLSSSVSWPRPPPPQHSHLLQPFRQRAGSEGNVLRPAGPSFRLLQTAPIARLPHHRERVVTASASATSQASPPLLTPPISYPLPPTREGSTPGSMSPLALEQQSPATPPPPPPRLNAGADRQGEPPSKRRWTALGLGIADDPSLQLPFPGPPLLSDIDPRLPLIMDLPQLGLSEPGAAAVAAAEILDMNLAAGGGGGGDGDGRDLGAPHAAQYGPELAGKVMQQPPAYSAAAAALQLGSFQFAPFDDETAMAAAAPAPHTSPGPTSLPASVGSQAATPLRNDPWADWVNLDGEVPP